MTKRFYQKTNPKGYFKDFLHSMKIIFTGFKKEFAAFISLNHESTKENISYISKNLRLEFLIKQAITLFIMFYYIFQTILPNGFLFTYYGLYRKNQQTHQQLINLKQKLFYTEQTLEAIKKNKIKTIEELLINNTGNEIEKRRNYISNE